MLKISLNKATGIAILEPDDQLSASDFKNAANTIDPYIEEAGALRGLVIATEKFPGWDSFAAFVSHMSFVKDHHKKITRIAIATDSPIGSLAQSIGDHFISATVKSFAYAEKREALEWVENAS
ncbi:MAG: STAS/SEC14 domain-containing protein [Halioglobus sp.]